MYSSKESVNILTALLVAHGIRHAVVCPGSRNAPIVHNLSQHPAISCYPVTDERSAAFFALGIAQATDEPVVVCVTSGTALLNVLPAVAEAHYQHQSLVVVSADRPVEWIGQLDGQTLEQPGALQPWVRKTVSLPEGGGWHCNRLVNEALIEATSEQRPCVHINVPLSEPLFQFTVDELPVVRVIRRYSPSADYDCLPQPFFDSFLQAKRPLVVFGQLSPRRFHYEGLDQLFSHVVVLHEALAPFTSVSLFEQALSSHSPSTASSLLPDFILHVGDAIVSKRLKHFLRQANDAHTWRISLTGEVEDTFQQLEGIVVGDAECVLQSLSSKMSKRRSPFAGEWQQYRRQWLHVLRQARDAADAAVPVFSEAGAVGEFERQLGSVDYGYDVHYANSSAVRLANTYVKGHPVWCNRGVNGIEGSLSTAAGFAAAVAPSRVFCVIGDLSFFYDQNALWSANLGGNLRILLLNNGHGAIFDQLPGLSLSPVSDSYVAGRHAATAQGICQQNNINYRKVASGDEMKEGIDWLLRADGQRPLLLEISLA